MKESEKREEVPSLFSLSDLESLMKMLKSAGVSEFEIERNGETIRIKRGTCSTLMSNSVSAHEPSHASTMGEETPMFSEGVAGRQLREANQRVESSLALVKGGSSEESRFHEVNSPMVGTFYEKPAPDSKPYVSVGDIIKKGDVLCIVEAMKLMNEIEADVAGRVVSICAEDAQMVEYGEVLFRIEPV